MERNSHVAGLSHCWFKTKLGMNLVPRTAPTKMVQLNKGRGRCSTWQDAC